MNKNQLAYRRVNLLTAVCALALILSGCGGGEDTQGPAGPGVASKSDATELNISVTGVTINSAPVVNFTVTNQDSTRVTGLTTSDLRFTIAKLIPGANGTPSSWQNYINTASRSSLPYIKGNRENNGTLVDNQNGTYAYTFNTDITDPAQTCPAAPAACKDANGNTLDTSYNASLVHRVAFQTSGSLPVSVGVYTFIPGSGAVASAREVVSTGKCNDCHNQLEAHDARINTQYCVLCHNPGSTAPVSDDGTNFNPGPVDFKVMIHKIHRGAELPSVVDSDGDDVTDNAGDYSITGYGSSHSFNDVHFPQDIENCTKCHDGTTGASNATAQGDNWKTQPSKAACGSCHDDVYFGASPSKTYEDVSHIAKAAAHTPPVTVGPDPTDDMCVGCHGVGQVADVVVAHTVPVNEAVTRFQYNIISICGTAIASNPDCAGAAPTVTFSVSDPSGGTHGYPGSLYNIMTDGEYTASGTGLNIISAWGSSATILDYNNNAGGGNRPARANSVNLAAIKAGATDHGDGTYTMTLAALPVSSGSAAVAMEGHPKAETVVGSGTYDLTTPVSGAVAYFTVDGGTLVERRVAVDITTKCDKCHNKLSLHGNNRADNAQLCVMCHNPRNTDVHTRPKDANGLPSGTGPDGKKEESIDFKRLIHAIHAAKKDDPNTTSVIEGHGFRENGIVVYGYTATSVNDFGHIRFPGILNDCTTCHNTGTYELTGTWAAPLQNGIQATTMQAVPDAYDAGDATTFFAAQEADQTNDLYRTPTAAVCSACHDGAQSQAHMETVGGAVFNGTAAVIATSYETCSICHGPGKVADVKVVHSVP